MLSSSQPATPLSDKSIISYPESIVKSNYFWDEILEINTGFGFMVDIDKAVYVCNLIKQEAINGIIDQLYNI